MGVAEPTGPLWSAVKGIYDAWPVDDEAVAGDLAGAWRSGGTVLAQGARDTSRAGEASLAAWRDKAGEQFHGRVGASVSEAGALQQNVANRAAHADYYGAQLASAKEAIVHTVSLNEQAYAQLTPAQQPAFAAGVAANLQAMIAEKAAELRAYPADSAPVSQFAAAQGSPGGLVNGERKLTQQERDIAKRVFGDSIDLDKVSLNDRGVFPGINDKAVTQYDTISFPPGTLTDDGPHTKAFHQWLIHELAHVWQTQHGQSFEALAPAGVLGAYDYGQPRGELPGYEEERQRRLNGLTQAHDRGASFTSFTTEQQADIIGDYYLYYVANKTPAGASNPYLDYQRYVSGVPKNEIVLAPYPPPFN